MKKSIKQSGINYEKITRKEALQKAGKYAAFTASAMILLLDSKKAAAASFLPSNPTEW